MPFPRPTWKPESVEPIELVVERMSEYTDRQRAFVTFSFGTAVFSSSPTLRPDLDYEATLRAVVNQHPDFNVMPMNDGNLLVRFTGPVYGLVLRDFLIAHDAEIRSAVETGGLLPGERLLTTNQSDASDEHYYAGLYARAKLYSDVEACAIAHRYAP